MPDSRDVKAVVAVVSNPIGKGDAGIVTEGFYTLDGDTLTMTDRDGIPLRDDNNGERITVRLLPTDNEKTVAKRTTLRLHRAERGDETSSAFNRRIDYGRSGLA
jgi:hypothetical protein